jgi:hypothetical protein
MKVKSIPSRWLSEEGRRFDCGPYMSGAREARDTIESLRVPQQRLDSLTAGYNGGIYNGPQFRRNYVDSPEHGVPFLTSGTIVRSDLSTLSLLRCKDAESPMLSYLQLRQGMTLISCSGTIGRMAYARPDMDGMWSSQDVMKIVPDPDKVPSGYIYAYLSSKFGVPLVISQTYGAIIQHLEPHHIANLPVPRLGEALEQRVHALVEEAARLRTKFQERTLSATTRLLQEANVADQPPHIWHGGGPDLGFTAHIGQSYSMRASNYTPRYQRILQALRSSPTVDLGEICAAGHLNTGARFKRIDAEPEYGVQLIGQKQGFWMTPEGRWISASYAPKDIYAIDESVMIASSGTLGESELYCRAILVTGRWLRYVYTQHFLRVVSGEPSFPGAYLFAFLRSDLAFRCLRSMSTGSKQQEIHRDFIARFPIPILTESSRIEIAELVREAFRLRDHADLAEIEAVSLVEQAIEEAA